MPIRSIAVSQARKTRSSMVLSPKGLGANNSIPVFRLNPLDVFGRSFDRPNRVNIQKRRSVAELRRIAEIIPIRRAIAKITDAASMMGWSIKYVGHDLQRPTEEQSLEREQVIRDIQFSLNRPNHEDTTTWRSLFKAVAEDIFVVGKGAIERSRPDKLPKRNGFEAQKTFWLWEVDINRVHLNPDWSPRTEGITPRFWDSNNKAREYWIPLLSKDLFLIKPYINTHEVNPISPVGMAYDLIDYWMSAISFQGSVAKKAHQNNLLYMEGAQQRDIEIIRDYWRADVEGNGEAPIIGSEAKGSVLTLGSTSREALYLEYCEFVLKVVALCFNLSARDMNLEADNKATAGIAADSSFQDAILPLARNYIEQFNVEVVSYYYPEYQLELADFEPRSEGEEATTAQTLFTSNLITRAEGRRRVGEEVKPEDDVFANGNPRGGTLEEQPGSGSENTEETNNEDGGEDWLNLFS